jgi:tetratricopeptide (TPR) repeat protein
MLWMRFPNQSITDRALLREAVAEWEHAGGPGGEISREVFVQQAVQGYYDDAAVTGHLFRRSDEVEWSVVELARIRAENGDLLGAKAMMKRFAGSDVGAQIAKSLALAQVSKGDLKGALETAGPGVDQDEILQAFARRQISDGDFAAALETAARMKSPDQVFYELGEALQERREQNRVRELASGMRDRKLAAEFTKRVRVTLWPPTNAHVIQATPCEIAADYGRQGKFAEADALIEQNECTDNSYVAIGQYASDPVGAERLLRSRSTADDLLFGLDQLAVEAAKKGNITEAFRFLSDLQHLKNGNARNSVLAEVRVTEAVHGIARYWTKKDGPNAVLKWARSRPTGEERAWALIGMAEALGRTKNHRLEPIIRSRRAC